MGEARSDPATAIVAARQWIRTPTSKVRPPVAQLAAIRRERLLARLEAGRFQILAIEAPGGFGKSTLAVQFAEQSVVTAWATLDETDADPLVLLSTLMSALDDAGVLPAGTGPDWFIQWSSDEPSFSRAVIPEFRRIVEASGAATLVLDQVDVAAGPQVRSLLLALVDSLPSGSSVVLVGRTLRSLPLPRWRSQGRLLTIDATDLLLDQSEVAQALSAFQGRRPDPAYVQDVERRTGGWPVAVYLGAFSDRYPAAGAADLRDYLDTEILARVDRPVVDFLRRTSPLEVLSVPACAAVLGDGSAVGDLLDRADASSLLVRAIQGPGRSFQVHALLREQLLAQFAEQDPAGLRLAHARASAWCRDQQLIDPAIVHARLSGDWELLGSIVWPAAADALLRAQGGRVRRWLDHVGEDVLTVSPALSLTAAWTAVSDTDAPAVARWREHTQRLIGPDWRDHQHRSMVEPGFALLLALDGAGDWTEASRACGAAEEALPPDSLIRTFAGYLRGVLAVWAGDVEGGTAQLERTHTAASARAMWTTWSGATSLLAIVMAQSGNLPRAQDHMDEAWQTWEQHHREGGLATMAIVMTASVTVACLAGEEPVGDRLAVALDLLPAITPILPWLAIITHATAARCTVPTDERVAVEHLRQAQELLGTLPPSPFLRACVLAAEQAVGRDQRLAVLSPAERRVWQLLQTRLTIREIAGQLYLSAETVKTHTAAIYRKLGVASRREAQELGESLAPTQPRA